MNFYGSIEDLEKIQSFIEDKKALFIVYANPLALGLLTPPGSFGADIVVGDTQPFGLSIRRDIVDILQRRKS
ncbi:hypothetical protein ACVPOS_13045 [Staphylococcus aureus]